jgi:hypothetical protein
MLLVTIQKKNSITNIKFLIMLFWARKIRRKNGKKIILPSQQNRESQRQSKFKLPRTKL